MSRATLALTGAMVRFFAARFGPYPFVAYGATVDDDSVGYALETQTRSVFSEVARESTVAHELAHQWMGNQVGPRRWSDIWLNEGWAEYAAWLWTEARGGTTTQEAFDEVLAIPAADELLDAPWSPTPGATTSSPTRSTSGAPPPCTRCGNGSATRRSSGSRGPWVRTYGGEVATTEQFRRLAERVSGQELDSFFDTWLDTPAKPTAW